MTPTAHKELHARIDRLTGNTKPRDSTTCLNAHRKDLRDYGLMPGKAAEMQMADLLALQERQHRFTDALIAQVRKDNPHAITFDVVNATALQRSRAFLAAFEPKGDEKPLTSPA
mgnify:CR=1 FL=1